MIPHLIGVALELGLGVGSMYEGPNAARKHAAAQVRRGRPPCGNSATRGVIAMQCVCGSDLSGLSSVPP
jgi:hypothetical protein